MRVSRREYLGVMATGAAVGLAAADGGARAPAGSGPNVERFVRFEAGRTQAYGLLEGDTVKELRGAPYDGVEPTGRSFACKDVKLLVPCEPSKVLALAGNYKSHLGDTPVPKNPEPFIKAPSALLAHEGAIVIPKGTADVHFEGELVIVIGKRAKDVAAARAAEYIFGYTCGNDVSARDWQQGDRSWWRAKYPVPQLR